jgi:hypothetical protein
MALAFKKACGEWILHDRVSDKIGHLLATLWTIYILLLLQLHWVLCLCGVPVIGT